MLSRLTDDISLLKLPIPYDLGEVNSYLIKGDKGFTIIDTGDDTEETKQIWLKIFAEYKIEKVVITHCHYDHMGLAGWMQEQFGVPVWMSDKTYDELKRVRTFFVDGIYTSPVPALFHAYGGPEIVQDAGYYLYEKYQFEPNQIFTENDYINIGDTPYRAIWTPGHSPDHFCFYNGNNGILFVGDHILNAINPIVLIQQVGENPLRDYIHAIRKIEQCSVKYMLTGHKEMIENPSKRILDLKDHYRKRWMQIYEQLDNEGKNAFDISRQIYGRNIVDERTLSGFMQTITNLEYLQSNGFARKEEGNGIFYFYKSSKFFNQNKDTNVRGSLCNNHF